MILYAHFTIQAINYIVNSLNCKIDKIEKIDHIWSILPLYRYNYIYRYHYTVTIKVV